VSVVRFRPWHHLHQSNDFIATFAEKYRTNGHWDVFCVHKNLLSLKIGIPFLDDTSSSRCRADLKVSRGIPSLCSLISTQTNFFGELVADYRSDGVGAAG
jgi:hypothetical protein